MLGASSSPEWLAFVERIKPALRIGGTARRARAHARAAELRGYAAELTQLHDAEHAPHETIVYIARTRADARDLRELERTILPTRVHREKAGDTFDRHRALGEALGFPTCCIDAFITRLGRGVDRLADGSVAHEDFVAVSEVAAASRGLHPLLNMFPLGYASPWLSHVPCRFDCDESLTYAAQVRDAYTVAFADSAAEIRRDLAADVAITRQGRRVALSGAPTSACALAFSNYLDPT